MSRFTPQEVTEVKKFLEECQSLIGGGTTGLTKQIVGLVFDIIFTKLEREFVQADAEMAGAFKHE